MEEKTAYPISKNLISNFSYKTRSKTYKKALNLKFKIHLICIKIENGQPNNFTNYILAFANLVLNSACHLLSWRTQSIALAG